MERKRPLLVGTVAVDFLHRGPLGSGLPPATLRWGGVVNNAACVLAARGARPVLATLDYSGEMRPAVAAHLAGNGVEWRTFPVRTPLPLFHAELVDGSVVDKHILGDEALELLDARVLSSRPELFDRAGVIVAATDSEPTALAWLADAAQERGVPFWLVSADATEVRKLRPNGRVASVVALNLRELALWAGAELREEREVVEAARRLAAPGGRALVTMGGAGCLLVADGEPDVVCRPAVVLGDGEVTVGAGDVLVGSLLAGRLAGLDWRPALAEAAQLTTAFLRSCRHDDLPYRALRRPPLEDESDGTSAVRQLGGPRERFA